MFHFADELIKIRKKAGLSQDYLAKSLGFSRSYICKLENGEREPNRELILKIANACKLDRYLLNKMLILADLEPELNSSTLDHKMCLEMVVDFKENGQIKEAMVLIGKGMKIFDNIIEIYALLANLHLLKNDFAAAIKINEEALRYYPDTKTSIQKLGISKAELIHNLGYVFFEKSLVTKNRLIKYIVDNKINKLNNPEQEKLAEKLRTETISDLERAITEFEKAEKLEPENEHITEQLARACLNMASIETEKNKPKLLKKAITMYNRVISFPFNQARMPKRFEASVFLAIGYAKLYDLKEAAKLINIVISCLPKNAIAYYAKSCIFAINGNNNVELLQISFDYLKKAVELNPQLKKEMQYDIDLLNLRLHPLFEIRFISLTEIKNEGIKL